ncbi:hypothetical protein [Georgenia sp. Marseille-Q6866]
MTRLALLESVFLPASVLEPLADELERLGSPATVVGAEPAADPEQVLAAYTAALGARRWDVVVAHSNAGLYVPALTGTAGVERAVFMDAVLPAPAGGAHDVAPAALREALGAVEEDGLLPRWTDWWPEEDARELFPDARTRAGVHAVTPRVPAAYLRGSVPVPAGWSAALRGACLTFGDTYAAERDRGRRLGWPVRTLPLHHLGFLTDPAEVGRAVHELATATG